MTEMIVIGMLSSPPAALITGKPSGISEIRSFRPRGQLSDRYGLCNALGLNN